MKKRIFSVLIILSIIVSFMNLPVFANSILKVSEESSDGSYFINTEECDITLKNGKLTIKYQNSKELILSNNASWNFILKDEYLYFSENQYDIWRFNLNNQINEYLFSAKWPIIDDCKDNRYLAYICEPEYTNDPTQTSLYVYDINTKEHYHIEDYVGDAKFCGDRLIYSDNSYDYNHPISIYSSDIYGWNKKELVASALYRVYTNESSVYYAEALSRDNQTLLPFIVKKCDAYGENKVDLSDVIYNKFLTDITSEYVEYQEGYDGNKERLYFKNSQNIKVILNGNELSFDQPAVIENDRVMVPVRKIFESLGYTLEWNQEAQMATATKPNDIIQVFVGDEYIYYNDKTYECDTPPINRNGRILVPVRAVSECAGCDVKWEEESKSVIISFTFESQYIKEHIDFIENNMDYLFFKTDAGFAGTMKDTFEEYKLPEVNGVWEYVETIKEAVSLDFKALTEADEYELILCDMILQSQNEDIIKEVNSSAKEAATMIMDMLKQYLNISSQTDIDAIENILIDFTMATDPYEFMQSERWAELDDLLTANKNNKQIGNAFEKISNKFSIAGFVIGQAEDVIECINGIIMCQVYKEVNDNYVILFERMSSKINENLNNGKIRDYDKANAKKLKKALDKTIRAIKDSKADNTNIFDSMQAGLIDSGMDSASFVLNKLFDKIKTENIYVAAITSGINIGVPLTEMLFNCDEIKYNTVMITKLGVFASIMNDILIDVENELKNEKTYDNAQMYHSALILYKNVQSQAIDSAIGYRTALFDMGKYSTSEEVDVYNMGVWKIRLDLMKCCSQ